MTCMYTKKIPDHITRIQKPRILGMIIATLEEFPEGLSAEQISNKLKAKGFKYYPATRTVGSLLGKYKTLFEELGMERVSGLIGAGSGWKVKVFKLRDDWNVDRKV